MALNKTGKWKLLPVLLVFSLVLNSCTKNTNPLTVTETHPAPTFTTTFTPIIPETTNTPQPVITSTPTLLPSTSTDNTADLAGMIIFAMGDGGYQHLFALHPNLLPLSRLTFGKWSDNDPAISPDGNTLAFTSNRSGQWDIYLWNLRQNTLQQITNTPDFESGLDWSPDGQWITYSSTSDGLSDIFIHSVNDSTAAPIQLTEGAGNNIDPSWSAQGRQIAFSTNRNGRYEIWLAQLDNVGNRFSRIAGDNEADYFEPAWSPDGTQLAWERDQDTPTIQLLTFNGDTQSILDIAVGKNPFWSPDGKTILTRLDSPNSYFLTGYDPRTGLLAYPLIALPAKTSQLQWGSGDSHKNLSAILSGQKDTTGFTFCSPIQSVPTSITGRISLVPINTVEIENAYLSDLADECFISLQANIKSSLGWDLLANLSSAALAITSAPDPGIPQNWLYTGRAFSLKLSPYEAGWLVVSRENYEGLTFWRVWAKCLNQDGSCGQIIPTPVWDFASRASGNLQAFESGGQITAPPKGYWVDVTDIAHQFGWQRIPSQSNWRTYYPGILFNTFVFNQGKSWQQAMAELYPQDVIDSVTVGK